MHIYQSFYLAFASNNAIISLWKWKIVPFGGRLKQQVRFLLLEDVLQFDSTLLQALELFWAQSSLNMSVLFAKTKVVIPVLSTLETIWQTWFTKGWSWVEISWNSRTNAFISAKKNGNNNKTQGSAQSNLHSNEI